MKFEITKYLIGKRKGKKAYSRRLRLPSGETIGEPNGSGYGYLGIIEQDDVLHREMKVKVKGVYQKMTLKPNLNAKSLITAMSIWAAAVVRYSASILKWTKEEISILDRKTRKLTTARDSAT